MLPDLGPGLSGTFDAGTLWWRHERFHRTVLRDFSRRLAVFRGERDAWEKEILEEPDDFQPRRGSGRSSPSGRSLKPSGRRPNGWSESRAFR